jgi:hypothetical protein
MYVKFTWECPKVFETKWFWRKKILEKVSFFNLIKDGIGRSKLKPANQSYP